MMPLRSKASAHARVPSALLPLNTAMSAEGGSGLNRDRLVPKLLVCVSGKDGEGKPVKIRCEGLLA